MGGKCVGVGGGRVLLEFQDRSMIGSLMEWRLSFGDCKQRRYDEMRRIEWFSWYQRVVDSQLDLSNPFCLREE